MRHMERLAVIGSVLLLLGCSGGGGGGGEGDAQDQGGPEVADGVGDVLADGLPDLGDVKLPPEGGEVGDVVPDQFDLFLIDVDTGPGEPLSIVSLDPSKGKTIGAEQVLMTGTGFEEGMVVMFGPQKATNVYFQNAHQAMVITPAGFPGPVTVQAINPDGETATLPDGFLYYNDVTITGADPAAGPTFGGVPIVITGSGFAHAGTAVVIGDRLALGVNPVDDLTILAITPPGEAGPANISVSNSVGVATCVGCFTYYEYPKIVKISPSAGPAGGGTLVTIEMAGAQPEAKVYFGDEPATDVSYVSAQMLQAVAPPAAVGFVDVSVVTQYGGALSPKGYYYYGSPVAPKDLMLLSVQPPSGSTAGGNEVQLSAFGLTTAADSTVLFGAKVAAVLDVVPSMLLMTVTAPAGTEGPVDVTVMNSNGTSTLPGGYTYLPVATLYDVTPDHGPAAGGTEVVISGAGFAPDAVAYFGALAAMKTEVLSPTQVKATTPMGSPGTVDVAVDQGGAMATLPDAFLYEGTLEVFVVDPNYGAVAGGTWIKLIGAGFAGTPKVLVGGNPATHVTLESYNVITAKTPPGMPGTVDVAVEVDGQQAVLPLSFTYYDPMSYYGGTWGGQVYHAVNVTVLDGTNGAPLPDAFVMLWADPDTPYQGFTDVNGQVTFSGPDLMGEQMVTASKECYSNSSVVEYNATNVTLYLIYNCPSMGGGMPPPCLPVIINGRASDAGKYIVIPPGPCNNTTGLPYLCQPCSTDEDCGGKGNICAQVGSQGDLCLTKCVNDTSCPLGFACSSAFGSSEGFGVCGPVGGKKLTYCTISKGHFLAENPDNGPGMVADAKGNFQLILDPAADAAVVCIGGVVPICESQFECTFSDSVCQDNGCWMSDGRPEITPYAMGVVRHVKPDACGKVIDDVLVPMDIPMTRKVNVFFDDPHLDWEGPNAIFSKAYIDFGSDGTFEFIEFPVKFMGEETVVTFEHLPSSLSGPLDETSFAILGAAVTADGTGEGPNTYALLVNIKTFDDDAVWIKGTGGWQAVASGVKENLYDLWGDGWNNVYGVGLDGVIVHFNGYSWQPQPSPTKKTLRSVYGIDGQVWAVGDGGAVARFDGTKWQEGVSPGGGNLRGVWAAAGTNVIAVGEYVAYQWNGAVWSPMPGTVWYRFNSVWGVNSQNVWAVGDYGEIIRLINGSWAFEGSPTGYNLYDVWGTSPTDVWAAGDTGTVIHYDGQKWIVVPTGSKATLKGIFGFGPDDVYFVGGKGTILHWTGTEFVDESVQTNQEFLTAFGDAEQNLVMASGNHQMVLTPFVTPVRNVYPEKGGIITENYLEWTVKPGPASSFYYLDLSQPSMFGPVLFWDLMTDGDVLQTDLPDFPNIQGTPGVPAGYYIFSNTRVYKEGFDIDHYDFMDLDYRTWRSFSFASTDFTAE